MDTSARVPSATIAPESIGPATRDSSMEDAQSLSEPIQRDPFYYNSPLIILVEDILFKVPRSYFENSDMFRETYLMGPQGAEVPDGLTDQQPLRLDGVDAAEFKCLLKAMIREDSEQAMSWIEWTLVLKLSLMWQMKPIQDLALKKIETHIDEWTAALKMSTRFKIQRLRDLAIQKLAWNLTSLDKIELAIECSIQSWLIEGYGEFVTRREIISAEDEERLGRSRTSNLFRIRHRRLEHSYSYSGYDLESDIQDTFANEFSDINMYDESPRSDEYARPDLHTATEPDVVRRDEAYYCVDIIFSVEHTLFKLPRYLFEKSSEIFRDMFLLPTPEGISYDGSCDEQPLLLEGVRKEDFRRLLKAMNFPSKYACEEPMLCNEWASALELSCMWHMANVRERAVKEILQPLPYGGSTDDRTDLLRLSTKLGIGEIRDAAIQALSDTIQPIERIHLGIELQVDSWLFEGYMQLVQARDGISVEHEERLGWKTTSKLFRIRDEYLHERQSNRYNHGAGVSAAKGKIRELFAEELKDAVWGEK